MASIPDIKEALSQTRTTNIFFTDINGRIMSLPVNPVDIEDIINDGVGFDGSSVAGYTTVDNSDRLLFPDPDSFRLLEISGEPLGVFIGRIYREPGKRALADPRFGLERILAQAEDEFGFHFTVGPEHEFFLLNGDIFEHKGHTDKAGYFVTAPHDRGEPIRKRILEVLSSCGIKWLKAHHEVTPSQHEINLEPTDPLTAGDRTILFNYLARKIAAEYGMHATFMPKPFDGYNRNAFHIHLSIQDLSGNNLFFDNAAPDHLSPMALQFIGGIVKYARETSLVMASNFNSYKAYVLEREAPVVRGWGFCNRSSMVRVPHATTPGATRIELRNPDPAGNVYLQLTTLIAMGLQGIREELTPGKPDTGSTYKRNYRPKAWDKRFLPKTMYEALVEAEKSKFLPSALGQRIYDSFMQLKMTEWEAYRIHVTERELDQYLDV